MPATSPKFGTKLNIESVAGTVVPLSESGLTQSELNAEGAGPGNPSANQPEPTNLDWQTMARQLAEANKLLQRKTEEADRLIKEQAEKLAASQFYEHQVGGRGGSDPLTDDSVSLVTLPDGREAIDIRVYVNKIPKKGKTTRGTFPITELIDGKQVVKLGPDGKPLYPTYTNWDLGRTTIRECPITVQTSQGPVTIQGIAILNVGRFTAPEVEERANRVESNLQKVHLSDADLSEDSQHLVGSDKDTV